MPNHPDRPGSGERPALRAAPWIFGASMLAVTVANAAAFVFFQSPESFTWESRYGYSLYVRSADYRWVGLYADPAPLRRRGLRQH